MYRWSFKKHGVQNEPMGVQEEISVGLLLLQEFS